MLFNDVSQRLDTIEKLSGRLQITQELAQLFSDATAHEASIIATLSLGQLRPAYHGTQFNFAQKNMIKVLAQVLDESVEQIEQKNKELGDLGLVAAQGQWKPMHTYTLEQVYDALVAIEEISGTGAQEEKGKGVLQLLIGSTPQEAKYIIRIMLGTLRLGFSDMTVIDALSWMEAGDKSLRSVIEHAYNICVDIGLITQTLKQKGVAGLEHMQIHMGIPIRPAAAERLPTAKDIFEKIGPCIAQPKLDGFRLQIHVQKKGNHIYFFSRNLQDMSVQFPDLVATLQKLDVDTLIAEGEAIVYDEATGCYLPFQETVKRKRKHGIEQASETYPLRLYLFDVLYLNGESFLDKTHTQRRAQLKKICGEHGNVRVIEERSLQTAHELESYFDEVISQGLEGLVVKKSDSQYQPGKRNFNWIKLKRQETGSLEDTLDVVVLGYYAGSGKRAHFGIGALLGGVYNKSSDEFQTIAKIGTGLTDQEWKDMKKVCDEIRVEKKPVAVSCAHTLYPDVWVHPRIVCQVRADEITVSPVHTAGKKDSAGYALRFPRFMQIRTDKGPYEATTVVEIERLYADQFKKK